MKNQNPLFDSQIECNQRFFGEFVPASPLEKDLSPRPTGTKFLNEINGLQAFLPFVPAVPAKKEQGVDV